MLVGEKTGWMFETIPIGEWRIRRTVILGPGDAASFYWQPRASHDFLMRELYSRIDPEVGYIKVNADASDEEVSYVVSQIRAREAKISPSL